MSDASRWVEVARWRDRIRGAFGLLPGVEAHWTLDSLDTGLSEAGAREALLAALDALSDEALADAAALPLDPWPHAVVVPASTVFTAPLEWCAVLLGRGSRVTVKRPRARAGLVDAIVALADGLPLAATDDRSVVREADLVVAMGGDAAVAAISGEVRPGCAVAAHGHAWSLSWIREPDGMTGVAADAALHDGRGCLSPSVVLTTLPLPDAVAALGAAMEGAEARWPRGQLDPAEGARIRTRRALARVVGRVVEGDGWAVHGVPAAHLEPVALPRVVQVVRVVDLDEAIEVAARWRGLSTVGTDHPASEAVWATLGASRVCPSGQMQRPPLRRLHDGVDWVATETGRPRAR